LLDVSSYGGLHSEEEDFAVGTGAFVIGGIFWAGLAMVAGGLGFFK
jgi:hypothetical protein